MIARILWVWLAAAVGSAVGAWVDHLVTRDAAIQGGLVGAAIGIAMAVAVDQWRANRLMRWLASPRDRNPPAGRDLWSEVGYRALKALQKQSRDTAALQQRLEQFFDAIEASPNGVLLLDVDDQIDWCNRAAADHFGVDPEGDVGQPITNLVRAPAFVQFLQSRRHDEVLVYDDARGPGTLSVRMRPFGEGMTLVISEDITERMRNEAMRRDFVANVSHEIRTPLTVLAGFVETMQTLDLSAAERTRMVELMAMQTRRMQTLVQDLLTLARLEGSPRPAPDRWVALAPLLERVRAEAEGLSAGRHAIEVDVDSTVGVEVAGDESELFSALSNLVSNAVRYTGEGGHVQVSCGAPADGGIELAVRDDGIGIAAEHLSKLAQRFYRVDGSRSRETGGTGLGLSIVKHVARRHGGDLAIESQSGQGSRFSVQIPAARVRRRPAVSQPVAA